MPRAGYRAVASWDEDTVTMGVEAARRMTEEAPSAIRFASTSAYFSDRPQSAIAIDALSLPRSVRAADLGNSRRAGTTALLDALLSGRDEVVIASEKRETQPGSAFQLALGDGAAAVRTGAGGGARLIGHASITHDFIDRYASRDHPAPYAYEERFVRDTLIAEMLVPAVREACSSAGITPEQIAQAAVAEPVGGCWASAARKLKCAAPNQHDQVVEHAGELGSASALFALGLAFEAASTGQFVLLVGLGAGVDALLFEMTGPVEGVAEFGQSFTEGAPLMSFSRFLSLAGSLELDWGMRSEFEQKAQATVIERVGREMIGFIGGRDSLGNVQFPKSAMPVNPKLEHAERLEDVRLAELEAEVVSVTADRLNFTPDPPFDFGLVQFGNGARVLMELVDRPAKGFSVGDRVRMRLRIKSQNRRLGFRSYFWKAAPTSRPSMGES